MQRGRRRNPYPHTWEVPLALLVAGALILVIGLQAGRSLANLFVGGGWVFVAREDLFSSIPGLVQGNAGAGLNDVNATASVRTLWLCMAGVEMLLMAGMAAALKAGLDRWGLSRLQGMATRAEAEELLGRSRLRRHARIIRPDLHVPVLTRWVNARSRSRGSAPSARAVREVEQ